MSFRHDGGLLVRSGEDGVAVVEGLHHIPDKVHELIGFGLAGETADLHDTAQVIDKEIAFLCVIAYLSPHFEDSAQRVKTFGVSFTA